MIESIFTEFVFHFCQPFALNFFSGPLVKGVGREVGNFQVDLGGGRSPHLLLWCGDMVPF